MFMLIQHKTNTKVPCSDLNKMKQHDSLCLKSSLYVISTVTPYLFLLLAHWGLCYSFLSSGLKSSTILKASPPPASQTPPIGLCSPSTPQRGPPPLSQLCPLAPCQSVWIIVTAQASPHAFPSLPTAHAAQHQRWDGLGDREQRLFYPSEKEEALRGEQPWRGSKWDVWGFEDGEENWKEHVEK